METKTEDYLLRIKLQEEINKIEEKIMDAMPQPYIASPRVKERDP